MVDTPRFRRATLAVWLLSVAGTVFVSLLPHVELPVDFWNADKLYHMFTYAWLGGLPVFAFTRRRNARMAAFSMIILGVLLEWGQSYVPGRSASLADATANTIGVFAGLWLAGALMSGLRSFRDLPRV